MDPLSDDKSKCANTNCLDRGSPNTADSAGRNRTQAVEVRLSVADMDRSPTVEKERHDGGIHDCALALVGRLVGDARKIDRLTVLTPVDASLQSVNCRIKCRESVVVCGRDLTNEGRRDSITSESSEFARHRV